LLNQTELGERNQSHSRFLRRLKELAGGKASDELLTSLWIQRLTTSVQDVLATCSDDLDKFAITADRLHDVIFPRVSSLDVASATATELLKESQIAENKVTQATHLTKTKIKLMSTQKIAQKFTIEKDLTKRQTVLVS